MHVLALYRYSRSTCSGIFTGCFRRLNTGTMMIPTSDKTVHPDRARQPQSGPEDLPRSDDPKNHEVDLLLARLAVRYYLYLHRNAEGNGDTELRRE